VGGVTWERTPIDPLPGPRGLDEISGAERLNAAVALADGDTRGPGDVAFAESRLAAALGERTVLVDPHPGPAAVGDALADAARRLGCDLVALIDVGGDVLAHGDEPGLGSPLCDAVMLASAPALGEQFDGVIVGAVFGPGCDGELTADEVLARVAELAAAGGLLGASGIAPDVAQRLAAAVKAVPTEASAQALRCAHGESGEATIRGGRRRVALSPLGALTFYFDPHVAIDSAARLAHAVVDCESLYAANRRLLDLGVATELEFERRIGANADDAR
jgi:hypothetical protein